MDYLFIAIKQWRGSPHSSKIYECSLTFRCSLMSCPRHIGEGGWFLCRDAICVFYNPQPTGLFKMTTFTLFVFFSCLGKEFFIPTICPPPTKNYKKLSAVLFSLCWVEADRFMPLQGPFSRSEIQSHPGFELGLPIIDDNCYSMCASSFFEGKIILLFRETYFCP